MNSITNMFSDGYFLTDGGLETTLIYHNDIPLNHFAAFELLNDEIGRQALKSYFKPYLNLATRTGVSFILETPTWRANPDWAYKLGYSHEELKALNKMAVAIFRDFVRENSDPSQRVVLSGNIGPRGDGYVAEHCMTANEARAYHYLQVQAFAQADADVVTAMTLNYSDEAIGIVRAAQAFHIPVVISFTVETNGRLPNGETLQEAIEKTDVSTGAYAVHYMINCAHPEHFEHILQNDDKWKTRIRGIRANASSKSHAELDASTTLDRGDECHLAKEYGKIKEMLPDFRIVGGCCGTDHNHLEEICKVIFAESAKPHSAP